MTANLFARLAAGLRDLEETKKADAFIASLPVVDLDEWATRHAPDMIADAELASGTNHHTTRKRVTGRLRSSAIRRGIRRKARLATARRVIPWDER